MTSRCPCKLVGVCWERLPPWRRSWQKDKFDVATLDSPQVGVERAGLGDPGGRSERVFTGASTRYRISILGLCDSIFARANPATSVDLPERGTSNHTAVFNEEIRHPKILTRAGTPILSAKVTKSGKLMVRKSVHNVLAHQASGRYGKAIDAMGKSESVKYARRYHVARRSARTGMVDALDDSSSSSSSSSSAVGDLMIPLYIHRDGNSVAIMFGILLACLTTGSRPAVS